MLLSQSSGALSQDQQAPQLGFGVSSHGRPSRACGCLPCLPGARTAHPVQDSYRRATSVAPPPDYAQPSRWAPRIVRVPVTQQPDTELQAAIVHGARDVIRPLVLEHFDPDSCVATIRIAIDALAYFGIHARPLGVQTLIFNDEATRLFHGGVSAEELHQAVWAHSEDDPEGPWTIGLGFTPTGPEPGRHMICWIPALSLACDFSLDQAARPHKGLALSPSVFPIDAPRTGESGSVGTGLPEGLELPDGFLFAHHVGQRPPRGPAYLEYRVVPDWFRASPNWRRTSSGLPGAPNVFREITGQAIRSIKERVPSKGA